MTDAVFEGLYAETYDDVYGEKDYEGECDLIERLFSRYATTQARSILDLGCGTGSHALPLARRGYDVVGVDRSEAMLCRARKKAASLDRPAAFELGDIREARLDRLFDAVIVLFAVLGYQATNDDALAVLRTARAHLDTGGLIFFDVWYGPAVLRERPSQRINVLDTNQGRVLRVSQGELDVRRQTCRVSFHLWHLAGGSLAAETEETHTMRFFFPLEVELLLSAAGFSLMRLGGFPEFERDPDEASWNVLAAARAI